MENLQKKSAQEIKDMVQNFYPGEVETQEKAEDSYMGPVTNPDNEEIEEETEGVEGANEEEFDWEENLYDSHPEKRALAWKMKREAEEGGLTSADHNAFLDYLKKKEEKKARDQEAIEMAIARELEIPDAPQVDPGVLQPTVETELEDVEERFGTDRFNQLRRSLKRLAADGRVKYGSNGIVVFDGEKHDNAMDVFYHVARLEKQYSSNEMEGWLSRTDEYGNIIRNPINVTKRVQRLFNKK